MQSFWLAQQQDHSTPAGRGNFLSRGLKCSGDMRSLDEFATAKLNELERANLRRRLVDTTRLDGIWALRNGRRLLSFSCNDYLNLTQHPAIKAAAIAALQHYGVGSGASRLVTGNHPLFAELDARLVRLQPAV